MKKKCYFQKILIGIGLCSTLNLQAQIAAPVFEDVTPADAPQVFRGNGAWGDYNNDGLIDLVVMGRSSSATDSYASYLTFYTNDGSQLMVSQPIAIPSATYNTVLSWIDYNNDGNLDLLLIGSTIEGDDDGKSGKENAVFAKLYKNNGVDNAYSFSEIEDCGIKGVFFGQERVYASTVSVGDYNNDGYPDIAFIGNRNGNRIEVYTNNSGTGKFTLLENPVDGQPFASMNSGSLAWGDYDGDGFLDLLATGWKDAQTNLKLYRNKGDGTFEEILSQIDTFGPYKGQIGWLDANGDGLLDFIVTGETKGKESKWNKTTDIYIQSRDVDNKIIFTQQQNTGLLKLANSAIDYADFNSDGLLDIMIAGNDGAAKTSIAMNNGSKYDLTTAAGNVKTNGFEGLRSGTSLALCDYDGDGYLDFFVMGYNKDGAKLKIYHNTGKDSKQSSIKLNTSPAMPSDLVMTPAEGKTTFSWTKGNDAETLSATLRYNLYVKKANGEVVALMPADINTGKLKVSDCTLATLQTSYTLNIPSNEIVEWGVQTIDQGKMSSEFAKQSVLYRLCYVDGGWETICLPFNVTKIVDESGNELLKENYTLKGLTGAENGALIYSEVESGMMEANVPYIFSLKKSEGNDTQKQYIFYGDETNPNENPSVEINGYAFTGTYVEKIGAEEGYVLNPQGTAFVRGVAETVIPAYCAYLTAPKGTSLKSIRISSDIPTGLDKTESEGMRIHVQDDVVEIYSTKAEMIKIYGIDGSLVRNVELAEGFNRITGLLKGIYLVSDVKIVIK